MKTKIFTLIALLFAVAFSSCSKDNEVINEEENEEEKVSFSLVSPKSITLSKDDTYQIEAISNNTISYESASDYYAKVTTTGLITANFVGSTTITVSDGEESESISIIISPETYLYDDSDFTHWGYSPTDMMLIFGDPDKVSGDNYYYYNYSTYLNTFGFSFDNDELILTSALISTAYTTTLANFLAERYSLASYSSGTYLYSNALDYDEATTVILLDLYSTSYWSVSYFDGAYVNNSTKSSTSDRDYSTLIDGLREYSVGF